MKNLEKCLIQLDTLGLNPDEYCDEYCIVSSGSLARGIRDCNDLDIITSTRLWDELKQNNLDKLKHVDGLCTVISFGDVEFLGEFQTTVGVYTNDYQIQHADIINGKRYQNLETVKHFKQLSGRDKDLIDLELIKQYESQL